MAQDLSSISVRFKAQSGLGVPASGADATGIYVLPSQGISFQAASIESELIQTHRMRKRPRQGSRSSTSAYQTELMVGAQDDVFEALLGGTWVAAAALDETDWGALTISGSGTILTFATGTIITDGVRAGMMAKLEGMSEADNDDIWFPIISVTEGVITIPAGILVDNAEDAAWDIDIAGHVFTPDPYVKQYFTVEEYWADADQSKIGTDMVWNSLQIQIQPDRAVQLSFGLGGRDMEVETTGNSPIFTDPVFTSGRHLVLLEGGIYSNGVKRQDVTGLNLSLVAPVTTQPMVSTRISPDTFLGQFVLSGQFTGTVEDGTDLEAMLAETQLSVHLHCAEPGANPAAFQSFYFGDLAFNTHSVPAGGEGAAIQTLDLVGGYDERGTGYQPTSVLISNSVQ
jgi:hypothetical protein